MAAPRLIDVARHAGVSMKTVSNVVNGYRHVRPDTRQRVQSAIDALGYRPNASARRLATGRTGTIAVVVWTTDVPYFGEIARALQIAAQAHGQRVVVEQLTPRTEPERAVLQNRDRGLVDGVIFHPVRLTADDLANLQPDFPLVLLGEAIRPTAIDHVGVDNVAAAAAMTEHLIRGGRRSIAFLGRQREPMGETSRQRLTGYRQALAAAGLPHDPSRELLLDGLSADGGYRVVAAALAGGTRFDALFCRDDLLAAGAIHALHDHGVSIPEQVAVAGWDDLQISRHLTPSLTTLATDKAGTAETAVELLIDRMNGFTGAGRHRQVEWRVVERASTRGP
ncbi:LacI family DNA-binding transcriptional regulator [Microlunatus speluncae]|uniref:LacI family DNA-binding transcriptional regulator n=1 Tax=Microlunatus speluncae TaxID=2594267 RepID=UPI0012664CE2|nr:LacI family DNA-binding transcriptional regulator [Microlunatus speluncae]